MANISPERRIAIAFIKVLRKYFDDYVKPINDNSVDSPHVQVEIAPVFETPEGGIEYISDEVVEAMKEIFLQAHAGLKEHLQPIYEAALIKVIGDALADLENTLREKFSPEELEELANIVEKESVKKLLGCFGIVDHLQEHCDALYNSIRSRYREVFENSDHKERMTSMMSDLMKKYGIEDNFEIWHDFFLTNEAEDEEPQDDDENAEDDGL